MGYNIDFEIAALLFEATFIVFFMIKRFLPTVQNRLYIVACLMSLAAVVLDIVTAFLDCNAATIPHVFIYAANTIYFCIVPALTFIFCLYCIYMAKQESLIHTPLIVVISIPLVISELLSLTNPLTGLVYYFENNVYMHGEWYPFEFVANGIYIVCIMAIMAISRNKITKVQFISTAVSCVLLSLGAILQGTLFSDVLLTNAFVSLAMVVTYLSLQNPDMFIDRTSNMFNSDAFHEISVENMKLGKDFSIIYFMIDDYKNLDEMKEHYRRGGLGDVKVKKLLINVLNEELDPIRARRHELEKDIPYIYEVLKKGSENAREVAAKTLDEVKAAMRINYFDDAELIKAQQAKYNG